MGNDSVYIISICLVVDNKSEINFYYADNYWTENLENSACYRYYETAHWLAREMREMETHSFTLRDNITGEKLLITAETINVLKITKGGEMPEVEVIE